MIKRQYRQGESFSWVLRNKINGTVVDLEEGFSMSVGFFNSSGKTLYIASTSDGTIRRLDQGIYLLPVGHKDSENMIGKVNVEFTKFDADGNIVKHSVKPELLTFEPRNINRHIN